MANLNATVPRPDAVAASLGAQVSSVLALGVLGVILVAETAAWVEIRMKHTKNKDHGLLRLSLFGQLLSSILTAALLVLLAFYPSFSQVFCDTAVKLVW